MNRSTRRGFLAGIVGAVATIGGTSAQEPAPQRATAVEDAPKLPDDVIRTYEAGETVWGDRYMIIVENCTIRGEVG